jgi:hypothetical protein
VRDLHQGGPAISTTATPDRFDRQLALAPLDEKVDHVRGSPAGRLIIDYGDYGCPYSRQAFHAIWRTRSQVPPRCPSVASMVDE